MNWSPRLGLWIVPIRIWIAMTKWISDEWSSDIILEWDQSRYGIFLANEYLNPNDIASPKNNSARQAHVEIYLNSTTSALPVLHRNAQRIVVLPSIFRIHSPLPRTQLIPLANSHIPIAHPLSFSLQTRPALSLPLRGCCSTIPLHFTFTLSSSFPDSSKFPGRAYLNPPDLPPSSCLGNYLVNRIFLIQLLT